MRDEDGVDLRELGKREIADAGSGVDQDVAVDEKRGRAQVPPADAAGATEHAQAHAGGYFSSNTVTGSQSAVIGVLRARVICSTYMRYSMQPGASRCKLRRLTSARSQLRAR